MVGLGKEYVQTRLPRDLLVARKFLAVVERQALPTGRRQRRKQPADRRGDIIGLFAVRAPDQGEARVPFNQRDEVPRFARSVDQISFPVSDGLARLHLGWPGVDPPLVWNPATPAIAFAGTTTLALAARPRQLLPELSARLGIGVDMLVDRLLAHPRSPLQPGARGKRMRQVCLRNDFMFVHNHNGEIIARDIYITFAFFFRFAND